MTQRPVAGRCHGSVDAARGNLAVVAPASAISFWTQAFTLRQEQNTLT